MFKNLFTFVLGALTGIVIMGGIVFALQSQGKMDMMPVIMLVCILILAAIAIIAYLLHQKHLQKTRPSRR